METSHTRLPKRINNKVHIPLAEFDADKIFVLLVPANGDCHDQRAFVVPGSWHLDAVMDGEQCVEIRLSRP